MVEHEIVIEKKEAISELELERGEYRFKIKKALHELPPQSTLYLDATRLYYAEPSFWEETIVPFLFYSDTRGWPHPVSKGKHLIIKTSRLQIIKSLEQAVNDYKTLIIQLDEKGVLRVVGKSFSPAEKDVFVVIMANNKPVIVEEIAELTGIKLDACRARLRKLYYCGLISRENYHSLNPPGRPRHSYFPYWPQNSQFWPGEPLKWEINVPDKNIMTFSNKS